MSSKWPWRSCCSSGAGLLARSFAALLDVPPGFAAERLLTFTTSIPPATYRKAAERAAFFERAATEIERLPGVGRSR